MARVEPYTIRLVGMCSSDTILRYLHMTAKSFTKGLSAKMFEDGAYALIPPTHTGNYFHAALKGPQGPLSKGVSEGLVQDQCGLGNINIAFLAHSSIVALVDRPPSRLEGIVVVNNLHLRVPKSRSALTPGARTRAHESMLSHTVYLIGAWKAQFCLEINANP